VRGFASSACSNASRASASGDSATLIRTARYVESH
jgi:hypothetical protein